jgi:hydrogenase-4 component B
MNLSALPIPALLVISALLAWSIGAVVALLAGARLKHSVYSTILFVGSALLLSGTITAWPASFDWQSLPPIYLWWVPVGNHLDPLASVYLILLGVITVAVSTYSPGYLAHLKDCNFGLYWMCLFLFVLSMAEVILSSNAITFLLFWEIMALSSVGLVATDHIKHANQHATIVYLAATRISTAFVTASFLWMHYLTGSWVFASWKWDGANILVPALILFIGLGIKSGLWPFHSWLPRAHPAAPSPVSALMSGVMVKVAIYAMVRFFVLGGITENVLIYMVLLLGIVSAAWGVLFALIQVDLKRLLAYSTVEHVGLICVAIALALLARKLGLGELSQMALLAALFHSLNHGIFKSLLFLGTGSIDATVHTRDLSFLGGLAKNMPVTAATFLVGSLAICALPPMNGFASKWLLYQSMFQLSFLSHSIPDRSIGLVSIGILSSIGALSLACFAKAFGIAFLGRPRAESAAKAREASTGMLLAQGTLAGVCVVLGLAVPQLISICGPLSRTVSTASSKTQFFPVPQPVLLVIGLTLIAFAYVVFLNRKSPEIRRYRTWDCGFGDLPARTEETGSSFSEPIAHILSPLLQYEMHTEIKGQDRRHFPESIKVEVSSHPILERYIYAPGVAAVQAASKRLIALQTGSIHVHLLYVFVTLILLVGIGSAL